MNKKSIILILLSVLIGGGIALIGPGRILMFSKIIINTQCDDNAVIYKNIDYTPSAYIPSEQCSITVYNNAVVGAYQLPFPNRTYNVLNIWEIKDDGIYINGVIGAHMPIIFEKIKEKTDKKRLILVNIPGSADDEIAETIFKQLYNEGFSTHLTKISKVRSGGTDFFASGVKRTMELGAKVGVHSWTDQDGVIPTDRPKEHEDHQRRLSLYKHTNVPEEFYWFTLRAAPFNSMHYMSKNEIKKYLLTK